VVGLRDLSATPPPPTPSSAEEGSHFHGSERSRSARSGETARKDLARWTRASTGVTMQRAPPFRMCHHSRTSGNPPGSTGSGSGFFRESAEPRREASRSLP